MKLSDADVQYIHATFLHSPTFIGDDDILDMPPYMVGRAKYDDELEDIIEMNPFAETPLFTGQQNASKLGSKFRKVRARECLRVGVGR